LSKNGLRQSALKSRRSLGRSELDSLSERIKARLLRLPEYASARTLSSYVAKSDEVQTARIIESALAGGKRVLVPRSDPASFQLTFAEISSLSELIPGHFGVLEPPPNAPPVRLDESDVVLVPVVAWDEDGQRLGYGKGYFDRALKVNPRPVRIGLALESQRHEEIPQSPADVRLDLIVTEQRVVALGERRR
jgi:5-formyltetrahydrofolate cyclo-ligase